MWLLYVAFLQLNPGAAGSPPGTGCQVGTSGCFPSAPPGPVTPPADPGATSEVPPPVVHPNDVPFYGELPAKENDEPILRQDVQQEQERQQQEQERQQQEQRLNELEGHAQMLEQQLEDQKQILEEQKQILQRQLDNQEAEKKEPEPSPAP